MRFKKIKYWVKITQTEVNTGFEPYSLDLYLFYLIRKYLLNMSYVKNILLGIGDTVDTVYQVDRVLLPEPALQWET